MDTDPDRKKAAAKSFDDLADVYLSSEVHRQGDDLETIAAWCANGTSVLDVATGAGHTAGAFLERGVPQVVATDASPSMVATAESEFGGVEGVVADAERLPFVVDSFDAVACRIAAHHFPNPEAFIREVARVLRSGGTFAFEDNVAPADDELATFINQVEGLRDLTHVESYATADWVEWMTEAGFSVEESHHFTKTMEFEPWVDAQVSDRRRRDRVEQLLLDAPSDARELFQIMADGDQVRSFANLKVLIRAVRTE